ncbi:hypothetical protein RvY_17570 [Ramazzottius varieornatus]|uniref:Uncharacterized protein n=1 Tax=Ramazzottius varieornatus TaxID=947166 RepID=A0A1D1W2L0_RAMVA|nr:hypothetical protein RvY_17570 [Ramazzottius varieornatus]
MYFLVIVFVLKISIRHVSTQRPATNGISDNKIVNICVMIGNIQAGQVAYERFAAIIDIGIKHANDLRLPANITLRKHHVPERPRSSGSSLAK